MLDISQLDDSGYDGELEDALQATWAVFVYPRHTLISRMTWLTRSGGGVPADVMLRVTLRDRTLDFMFGNSSESWFNAGPEMSPHIRENPELLFDAVAEEFGEWAPLARH
jgi:hypothetical protein